MSAVPVCERNQDATIYVGGLDERVNESILWELFVQAGPVGKRLTRTLVDLTFIGSRLVNVHQPHSGLEE